MTIGSSAKFQSVGKHNSLHPTCRALLDNSYPDPWEMSLVEARREFQRHKRDISGPIPSIRSIETVHAEINQRQVPITLYRPRVDKALPLAIYIHGGGFVIGEHDFYHAQCARVANAVGCIVASVGYGLSPEHRFPQPLEDCRLAYNWLLKEHEWLGIKVDNVAIYGDSAGANLAAALGVLATQGVIPAPQMIWMIYPVTDMLARTESREKYSKGFGLDESHMRWYRDQYLADSADAAKILASPGRMSGSTAAAFSPTLIQTAGFDPLKDEARELAELLYKAEQLLSYTCYEEMTHGFINAFDLLTESQMAIDEGIRWLRKYIT